MIEYIIVIVVFLIYGAFNIIHKIPKDHVLIKKRNDKYIIVKGGQWHIHNPLFEKLLIIPWLNTSGNNMQVCFFTYLKTNGITWTTYMNEKSVYVVFKINIIDINKFIVARASEDGKNGNNNILQDILNINNINILDSTDDMARLNKQYAEIGVEAILQHIEQVIN